MFLAHALDAILLLVDSLKLSLLSHAKYSLMKLTLI